MRLPLSILLMLLSITTMAQPVLDLSLRKVLADTLTNYTRPYLPHSNYEARFPVIIKGNGSSSTSALHSSAQIAPGIYTARLTREELRNLAADHSINRIAASTRHRLLTDNTREATQADLVHAGEELDLPFTGKGVIIAVVDEGFEYNHATFLDQNGQSRVKYVWNRRIEGSEPTAVIPEGGDGYTSTGGHGTHTASIAAGASVSGSNLYGMAPEADLIFIPSNLDNAELLEDAAFVANVASDEGKPWVMNFSFGSHDGPHDGLDLYSQTMDNLLTENNGFLVAAMGNEAGSLYHASGTFESDADTLRFMVSPESSEVFFEVWAQPTDSLRHTTMRPFVFRDGEIDYESVDFSTAYMEEVNADNRKQHAIIDMDRNSLYYQGGYMPVGIEVALNSAESLPLDVHAWTDEGWGSFYCTDNRFVSGDDRYLACEGGACVPSAIAVAAYAAANSTTRLNGAEVSFSTTFPLGKICYFSNYGPYLGEEQKPTVTAPGAIIRGAVSKVADDFSTRSSSLVEERTYGGEKYYYGFKSGTSMSSPVVAGILALWLEAYPKLTHAQLLEVLSTTSHSESDVTRWGYGRIDAYEGLKAVLQLAEQTGIEHIAQDRFPAALRRTASGWQILACQNIANMEWRICHISGRTLKKGTAARLVQGEETDISTSGLPSGIYLLQMIIDGKSKTKKFILI